MELDMKDNGAKIEHQEKGSLLIQMAIHVNID